MKPRRLRGLLLVNAAMLALLAVVAFNASVDAQARNRGTYTMVGGGAQGVEPALVYVVDETNLQLVAVVFDQNRKQLRGVGYRNLAADGAGLMRRRN